MENMVKRKRKRNKVKDRIYMRQYGIIQRMDPFIDVPKIVKGIDYLSPVDHSYVVGEILRENT